MAIATAQLLRPPLPTDEDTLTRTRGFTPLPTSPRGGFRLVVCCRYILTRVHPAALTHGTRSAPAVISHRLSGLEAPRPVQEAGKPWGIAEGYCRKHERPTIHNLAMYDMRAL